MNAHVSTVWLNRVKGNLVDRNGNRRVLDDRIDIGAFEVGSVVQRQYLPMVTNTPCLSCR